MPFKGFKAPQDVFHLPTQAVNLPALVPPGANLLRANESPLPLPRHDETAALEFTKGALNGSEGHAEALAQVLVAWELRPWGKGAVIDVAAQGGRYLHVRGAHVVWVQFAHVKHGIRDQHGQLLDYDHHDV